MTFEIENIERLTNGSALVAVFDLTLPGAVVHRCRLMAVEGKQPFIAGPSSKDAYSPRGWRVHATLDADLAAEVCAAICSRLAADEDAA